MKNKVAALSTVALLAFSAQAFADPIEKTWVRPNGHHVKFSACGDSFCAVAVSGPHAGGNAGKLKPTGNGKYSGSLTDLDSNKTYTGYGTISGGTLKVSGCVMGFFCKSENWTAQ